MSYESLFLSSFNMTVDLKFECITKYTELNTYKLD